MPYELIIGLRYLKAKRKSAFISIITLISMAGVTLGVMALIIVLAVATLFRTWGALDVPFYIGDEALCVPAAKNFVANGTRWEWRNPPVNALILGGTIALFARPISIKPLKRERARFCDFSSSAASEASA